MCFASQQRALFPTSEPPKVVRTPCVFNILTSKCASHHNSVHFFKISTSKSGPTMVCFVHFDFDMCFAPQWRALFRHLNLQKWSDNGVFCTFWLRNVLRAATACTFSDIWTSKSGPTMVCFVHFDFEMCFASQQRALFPTSEPPKVVRQWCALYILTWKCASRHNGVHFFDIATSKSGPTLRCFCTFDFEMCFAPQRRAIFHLSSGQLAPPRRFSEPTFRPSGASNHWKNTVFRDFPTFSRICIFFLLTFSLLLFSLLIFSLLSASALLCFSSVHIVGSLTSKLFLRLYTYIYIFFFFFGFYCSRGSPGSRGGQWSTKTPPRDPCKRTCWAVVAHLGTFKSPQRCQRTLTPHHLQALPLLSNLHQIPPFVSSNPPTQHMAMVEHSLIRPWTDIEDQELINLKNDTKSRPSWKSIGARLRRDPQTCKMRWTILKQMSDQHGHEPPPHEPEAED